MDFDGKDIDHDMWEWREDEYCLQRDSANDFSRCLWDNVDVNEDSLMCMLDEQTPIKDCAEFGYQVCDVLDDFDKGMEERTETSQMKRRRMLQFTSDANEMPIVNERFTSICLKSKVCKGSAMEDGLSKNLEWTPQWDTEYEDDRRTFYYEGWDQASEGWLVDCLNENEMQCSLNEMDDCTPTDVQVDAPDFCKEMQTDILQEKPKPSPIKFIKGRKSVLKAPKKLVTGTAYPFTLIKPCGVQGDVTLKEINQKIHAPPPSKSKQKIDEDPSLCYPTSAYSGKPVVLKTKIRTEGGRGSITIMRTKG